MKLFQALNLDCLSSSHPIEVEVKDPADINQIFDTISYCKVDGYIEFVNKQAKLTK